MSAGPDPAFVARVLAVVGRTRLDLGDEKRAQSQLAEAFLSAGIGAEREVRLAPGDIVDFLFEIPIADPVREATDPGSPRPAALVLELKLKGGKRAIFDQCSRYCGHARVAGLILATAVATGFPPEIAGKPCWVASLGRAWL